MLTGAHVEALQAPTLSLPAEATRHCRKVPSASQATDEAVRLMTGLPEEAAMRRRGRPGAGRRCSDAAGQRC